MSKNEFYTFLFFLAICVMVVLPASGIAEGDMIKNDSQPSSWAEETVNKAKNYNLTTPKTTSGYQGYITREEFCELVVKLYNATYFQPAEPASPNPFNDTANPEILKAYNLNIVNGYGGGRFAPDEKITREQLACMFYNYLTIGFEYQGNPPELGFEDRNEVSVWAEKAVKVMVDTDIIGGVGNNRLDPQGYATREQAIVLVVRFYEMVPKVNGVSQSEVPDNNPPEQTQANELEQRSKEEIITKWESLQPANFSKPFEKLPSVSAPYAAGKLTDGYLKYTLDTVNFIRYLAGLPADLTLDTSLNQKAQYAAVLEAAVG